MLTAAEISTIRPRRSGLEVSDCHVGIAVVFSAAIPWEFRIRTRPGSRTLTRSYHPIAYTTNHTAYNEGPVIMSRGLKNRTTIYEVSTVLIIDRLQDGRLA